jgi:type I restriction enzyme S subunit
MKPIDISVKDLETVKTILAAQVPEYEVRAFGSRVQWTSKDSSDLDLVVMTEKPLEATRLADLKEAFSESDLPFKVDVVDWAGTKEGFRKIIEKQFEVISKKNEDSKASLYFPNFPKSWKPYSLYSLAEWINGMAFRDISFADTGKPVIKIAEIKNGISGQTKYTTDNFDPIYYLTDGDMLFSWSGQPETSIDVYWYHGPDGWLNQHIFKVIPKENCEKSFFYYILKYVKPNFIRIALNKQTTGLGHVTKADLQKISVRIPDKNSQRAIAHILGTLDDKIELNRRMNQTLEEIARAIFKSWFVDFDPVRKKAAGQPTGLPEDIDKLFPDSFEESELGEIPKGWKVNKLEEYVDTVSITHRFEQDRVIFLNTSDIFDGVILHNNYSKVIGLPGQAKKSILKGDILFSEIRPANKRFAYVDFDPQDYVVSTKLMVLRCKGGIEPIVIYFFLKSEAVLAELQLLAESRSGTFPQITFDQVKFLKIIVPHEVIMKEYSTILGLLYGKTRKNHKENESIGQLRDSLLPPLLSGTLSIPKAEKLFKDSGL